VVEEDEPAEIQINLLSLGCQSPLGRELPLAHGTAKRDWHACDLAGQAPGAADFEP